jgi:hypothetical protein
LLGERSCRQCGQSLGALAVLRLAFKDGWDWVRSVARTRCPECREIISLRESGCPHCGKPVTFSGALDATVKPTRSLAGEFLRGLSPEAKLGIRWTYVVLSILAFWALLPQVERIWNKPDGVIYSFTAILYVAFLYLFFLWLVPRSLRSRITRQIRLATKIAFLFNFFSVLMLLLVFIEQYWGKASKIALLFGIIFAGFWLFSNFVRNLWLELAVDWQDGPPFNHLGNQGRSARFD